ncbi:hypothetical protein [Rufibacter soli]
MKNIYFLICLCLPLAMGSCQEEPTAASRAARVKQAYDMEGFLNQEAKALAQAQPKVTKTVYETGKAKDTKTLSTLKWADELAPFSDADLNKPALMGLYSEEVSTNAAGQTVKHYRAQEDAKTNLQEATYTFDPKGQLVQVDALILQENLMFKTRKKLHLEARPNQTPRLKRYRLDETQELMFMSPDEYGVEGVILP